MLTVNDLLKGPRSADTLDQPVEHLAACHRRVEQRLETLARAGEHLADDREKALAAIDASLRFFATNGVWHTADEEESVFPRLLPRLSEEERAMIWELERDHDVADGLHARLGELAAELHRLPVEHAPVKEYLECVERLTGIYRRHIEIEDTQVAPLAKRNLSEAELVEISAEMKSRRRPQAQASA